MAPNDPPNTQSQIQQQIVTVSIKSSDDPDLEQRIFSQVHSAGRQLKIISSLVEELLATLEAGPNFVKSDALQSAITAFKDMRLDILRAKDTNKLVSQLEGLQKTNPTKFDNVRSGLKDLLENK